MMWKVILHHVSILVTTHFFIRRLTPVIPAQAPLFASEKGLNLAEANGEGRGAQRTQRGAYNHHSHPRSNTPSPSLSGN